MKYKKYDRYKDSGIEWIGSIPKHWDVSSLRWYISCKSGEFISTNEVEKEHKFNKVYKVIGGNGVMGYCNKYNVENETVAIGRVGALCGNIHLIDEKVWITDNSLLLTYVDNRLNLDYLKMVLECINLNRFSTSTAQPLITGETIKTRKIAIPSFYEQEKIVKFLDKKTSEIDKLIEEKEKLIELLKEKREAIITEAVTKGLDKNVKMKDSGVEWIGEIPESWGINKIRYSTYVKGRIGWQGLKSDEFIDEGPYLVTGTDFKDGKVNWGTCYHISNERYEEAPAIQLKEKDLLITKDGTIGKIAIVKEKPDKAILNSGIFVTRNIDDSYLTEYMYYILTSNIFDRYIKYMETGSTIKHLYQETFINFSYPLPKLEEQKNIIKYLDEKINIFDKLIEENYLELNMLNNYKKSLISEVVTGKIDVRNEV
ncbi:restriction endonuclease subunit S [Clostridium baratii]|uniref:restriction endonuclease subunit S n=1 Tax=Clostridium baratii TaxID=1561 RepID=UPI001C2158AB|nr:restriction endonuclease subunit S [Clostridium baratii]